MKKLQAYIDRQEFRQALGIPADARLCLEVLAQGEYNKNYTFIHPVSGKKLVFRLNTGSQMHLKKQIDYEYLGLKLLENSGRTPKPLYVDGSKKYLDHGVMVMEFLEGNPLNYEENMEEAAAILADIHSVPVEKTAGLLDPGEPLQAILDECQEMVRTYDNSELGDPKIKIQIRRMLQMGQNIVNKAGIYDGYRCCINTELNSGNFLINGKGKANYLIDWEKPLYGEVAQDLGHFLAPTTTFWKTDTILSQEECMEFVDTYIRYVDGRFDVSGLKERVKLFLPITCLRGITWCAMAWVEYQQPGRLIRNEETFHKMEAYLENSFLNEIENFLG